MMGSEIKKNYTVIYILKSVTGWQKKLFHRINKYVFNLMIFLRGSKVQDVLIEPHELGIVLGCH